MAIIKLTFGFRGASQGWSETYYKDSTNLDLTTHIGEMKLVAPKRAELLGPEYDLFFLRAAIFRDNAGQPVQRRSAFTQVLYRTSQTWTGDPSWNALIADMRDQNETRRKPIYLRGIPDEIVRNAGTYTPAGTNWLTLFNSWASQVLQLGYGWWGQQVQTTPYPVTNYTEGPLGAITITYGPDPQSQTNPFTAAELLKRVTVNHTGINGDSSLNGDVVVIPQTATSAQTYKRFGVIPYVAGGVMRRYSYAFVQASKIDVRRVGRRKPGAPFLQQPGRRRATIHT